MIPLIQIFLLLTPQWSFGQQFSGKTEMNGISYSTYADFENKWKFVTVRYRTDSGEQRFVWGNSSALSTLESGSIEYPDGAVFAKIGFMTTEDEAFKSSRAPSGAKRYQFMVRNKEKYAATGGWGYALFDADKKTFEVDPTLQAQACYACHLLVPHRGQVFSQSLKIAPVVNNVFAAPAEPAIGAIKFINTTFSKLPEMVQRSLPKVKTVRTIDGDLRHHVFRGTIDEIRPSLIDESKKTGLPAALVSSKDDQFSVVYKNAKAVNCPTGTSFKSVFSTMVPSPSPNSSPFLVVAWQDICI